MNTTALSRFKIAGCAAGISIAFLAVPTQANDVWYRFVDDNGVVNISDRAGNPRATSFDPNTFEAFAMRQRSIPHPGRQQAPIKMGPEERRLSPMLAKFAKKNGVELALVKAVVAVESGFRVDAKSRVGAIGLMQLMPATAKELGVDPSIPEENVDGGTRYLAGLLRMFKDERLALAAYNAGPGRVRRAKGIPEISETKRYVREVILLRARYARTSATSSSRHVAASGAPIGR